jgi:tetratricopeptide (TPR) repeat protein
VNFRGIKEISELNKYKQAAGWTHSPQIHRYLLEDRLGGIVAHPDRSAGMGGVGQGLLKAKGYIAQGKFNSARQLLVELRDDGSQHADIHYLLGETLRRLGDYPQALTSLSECLRFEAFSEYVWKSLALIYLAQGKYDKAVPLFKKFATITVGCRV